MAQKKVKKSEKMEEKPLTLTMEEMITAQHAHLRRVRK